MNKIQKVKTEYTHRLSILNVELSIYNSFNVLLNECQYLKYQQLITEKQELECLISRCKKNKSVYHFEQISIL